MTFDIYREQLLKAIQEALDGFNGSIPGIQQQALDEALDLIKDLELKDGQLVNNVANLKKLGEIRSKLEGSIVNEPLQDELQKLVDAYGRIATIQNKYFRALDVRLPDAILRELQIQAQEALISQLTAEIDARIIPGVEEILRLNITTGGSYRELASILTEYIIGKGEVQGSYGKLAAQAATITIDSLNTYTAQYSQIIAQNSGMEWYMYTGSLLTTSREFCEKMVEKKYVHISEFPDILKGKVDDHQVKINPKTELWYGAKESTTVENITLLRGGWRCGHQFLPTSERSVPVEIRIAVYDKNGIKHKEGTKLAA